jgi:hypothetical protein
LIKNNKYLILFLRLMAGTMEFAGMRMYEEYSLKWEMETEM